MPEAAAKESKGDGGRGSLPGIPAYVDRVSAECMWRDFCDSEAEYLERRLKNPPKGREPIGSLHGFEVVKHPTYISVRRVRRSASAASLTPIQCPVDPYQAEAVLEAASEVHSATTTPSLERSKVVLPKYGRFSGEHMKPLELAKPGTTETAAHLQRIMIKPSTVDRMEDRSQSATSKASKA